MKHISLSGRLALFGCGQSNAPQQGTQNQSDAKLVRTRLEADYMQDNSMFAQPFPWLVYRSLKK